MMTVINKRKSINVFIILFFLTISALSQNKKDKVFILFDDRMNLTKEDNNVYKLNFMIKKREFYQSDSYIFYFDNFIDFERVELKKFQKKINIEKINLTTIDDFKTFESCELHDFFNKKNIYLIKKENKIYYMYPLIYFATTKWETIN